MDYLNLYSTLLDGIAFSLQDTLAAIWFATAADLLAYGAIVIGLFVVAWSLLTWAAHNTPEVKAEARDERDRLRVWALILAGVDISALSQACPPPATVDTVDTSSAERTDGVGADGSDYDVTARTTVTAGTTEVADVGRAA